MKIPPYFSPSGKHVIAGLVFCLLAAVMLPPLFAGDVAGPALAPQSGADTDWVLFSDGLYFKNLALDEKSTPSRTDREAFMRRALELFQKAALSGNALDLVYYQIADCYFGLYEYSRTIEYADKSISVNNTSIEPYILLYKVYVNMQQNEKAAQVIEEYLKVRPDSVQAQFKLGEHYLMKLNDQKRAAQAFERVIGIVERVPTEEYFRERAHYYIGFIRYREKRNDEAAAHFRAVIRSNDQEYNAVYILALISMERYDLEEAAACATRYLAVVPLDPSMHGILGRIHYLRQSRVTALPHLLRAKTTANLEGVLAFGLASEILGNDEKAVEILGGIAKLHPALITPHLGLARIADRRNEKETAFNEYVSAGVLLFDNGLFRESLPVFSAAARFNTEEPGVFYYLGRAHEELGHVSLALYYFRKAYALKPSTEGDLHIGYLLALRKEYAAAFACFDRVIAKEPANPGPWFLKGLISFWRENLAEAETFMRKALELDGNNESFYFHLAIVLDKTKRWQEAAALLEKAIERDPGSARSYNYLGYLFAENGVEVARSLSLVQKALELDPENGAYVDSLGWVYFKKGDYHAALEQLLHAESLLEASRTPDAVVFDHIGDVYDKLGNRGKAQEYWQKSVNIKSDPAVEDKIRKGEGK